MLAIASLCLQGITIQRQLKRTEIFFLNLIDLSETSKRHALVGEVLMIGKLKCRNCGPYKFCPGLAFIGFMTVMTLLTGMTEMSGIFGITNMTGMTGMTNMTRMTRVTRMAKMTGTTRLTMMVGVTGIT